MGVFTAGTARPPLCTGRYCGWGGGALVFGCGYTRASKNVGDDPPVGANNTSAPSSVSAAADGGVNAAQTHSIEFTAKGPPACGLVSRLSLHSR
jgi:hypothetical protein